MSTPLPYADRFAEVAPALPGAAHPAVVAMREAAIRRALGLGLPTTKVERWKYTPLKTLIEHRFEPAPVGLAPAHVPLPDGHRLVFVNGRLVADLSIFGGIRGVDLGPLAERLDRGGPAPLSDVGEDDAFAALNTAFMADGAVLTVARGIALEEPIHLVFMGDAASPVAFHARNLIRLEPGASATLIERHVGTDGVYWSNPLTEIAVGEGASLRHYKLQEEGPSAFHIALTAVEVAAGGSYESFALAVGGALARNEIKVALVGAGASCRLDGVYLGRRRQHLDATTEIVHARPETVSRETYKGVLDERARGVFQGRIVVRPDAQKSDGHQVNKTLLLSGQAEIDAKPELEIHADDVKCGHGAAAGELDQEALFYLRARGIDRAAASRLLTEAFVGDVIEAIADPWTRAAVAHRVGAWLATLEVGP